MKLDDLPWRAREKEHYFDIACVKRRDGKYVVIERVTQHAREKFAARNYSYATLWLQKSPYKGGGARPYSGFIQVDDPLTAQCVLIQLLKEIEHERSESDRAP